MQGYGLSLQTSSPVVVARGVGAALSARRASAGPAPTDAALVLQGMMLASTSRHPARRTQRLQWEAAQAAHHTLPRAAPVETAAPLQRITTFRLHAPETQAHARDPYERRQAASLTPYGNREFVVTARAGLSCCPNGSSFVSLCTHCATCMHTRDTTSLTLPSSTPGAEVRRGSVCGPRLHAHTARTTQRCTYTCTFTHAHTPSVRDVRALSSWVSSDPTRRDGSSGSERTTNTRAVVRPSPSTRTHRTSPSRGVAYLTKAPWALGGEVVACRGARPETSNNA